MSRQKLPISEVNINKIGGRVAYIRLKNDLPQSEFSKMLGISIGNISGMENHKYEPSYKAIMKILEVFNINPNWLLSGEGDMTRKPEKESGGLEDASYIYKEGDPGDDPELTELLKAAREILESGNQVAYDALKRNIEYFSQAIKDQVDLAETKRRLNGMEARINKLEKRLTSDKIRESDDPTTM